MIAYNLLAVFQIKVSCYWYRNQCMCQAHRLLVIDYFELGMTIDRLVETYALHVRTTSSHF